LFVPMAQGNIRPLSERAFFLTFSSLFGMNPLPYRLFILLNQLVNVALLMLVARRLTRSATAGLLAPVLWLANISLIIPMSWSATYNQIQCATFFLLSFYLFIRYTETGKKAYYAAQWLTFLLGLFSLELMVVYPAVAALFALLMARAFFRSTLPMLVVSMLASVALGSLGGNHYNFYYDRSFHVGSLLATFWEHWKTVLGCIAFAEPRGLPPSAGLVATGILSLAIIGFVVSQALKKRFLPLLALGWFVIALGPFLPLHNRKMQYYPELAAMGLAILAAVALAQSFRGRKLSASFAVALAILYMVPSLFVVHAGMRYYFERGERVRLMVEGVEAAKRSEPGRMILLKGIDDDLFWASIYYQPFRLFGWHDVFLTPENRVLIFDNPHFDSLGAYFFPDDRLIRALRDRAATVLGVNGRTLTNVTISYMHWIDPIPYSVPADSANR
jgi:hypothetical protein